MHHLFQFYIEKRSGKLERFFTRLFRASISYNNNWDAHTLADNLFPLVYRRTAVFVMFYSQIYTILIINLQNEFSQLQIN